MSTVNIYEVIKTEHLSVLVSLLVMDLDAPADFEEWVAASNDVSTYRAPATVKEAA